MHTTIRQLGIYLGSWIEFYKNPTNLKYGVQSEDIAPRETDILFGRYYIP